jgi:hypothetical protein
VQAARAGATERGSGGESDQAMPAMPTTIDPTPHLKVIEARVLKLEHEYDAYLGVAASRDRT